MNNKHRLMIMGTALLGMVGLLTSCGGGGGGGGGGGLATGGFSKTYAPDVSTSSQFGPFNTAAYRRYMQLYRASDINGSGNIDSISFRLSSILATASTCPNVTIRMGHSTKVALSNTTFSNQVEDGAGSLVTVLNDKTVNILAGAIGDYYTIPLDTSFNYNGVDSLVVDVERTTACDTPVANSAENVLGYNGQLVATTVASPTGSLVAQNHQAKFNFAGGENTQDYGGTTSNVYPFSNGPRRTQNLYLASDINGSGPITGIAFQSNLSVAADYTYSLTLGHSNLTALTATFADNFTGTSTQVANAVTFSMPAGVPAGEWIWVPIPDGSFTYNGTDNLIADVAISAGTANNGMRWTGYSGRQVYALNDTATTGTVSSPVNHIKLRFNGARVNVIGGNTGSTTSFLSTADGQYAFKYNAAQLGTKGTISKLACRINSDVATNTDFPNTKIVLGHASATALTTTYADNMVDATTVYNATHTVSGGKLNGDWTEFNLSPSFSYNGVDDLIVHVFGGVGAGTVKCKNGTGTASAVYSADPASATGGSPANYLMNIGLTVSP